MLFLLKLQTLWKRFYWPQIWQCMYGSVSSTAHDNVVLV